MIYCTGCGKKILYTRPPIGVDKYFHDKACYMKWAKQYQEGEPNESKSVPEMSQVRGSGTDGVRRKHKV